MSGEYLEGVMAELAKTPEVKTDTVLTGRIIELEAQVDALKDMAEQRRVWLIQEGLDPNTGRRVIGTVNSKATHLLFDAIVAREDAARCRILIGLAEFAGRGRFEDVDACPWCNGPQLPLDAVAHRETCPAFSARGAIR